MPASIAAYTMYGFEWLRADIRTFWAGAASRLRDAGMPDVPSRLTWKMPEEEQWHAPNLLLGQTCGYPLMKGVTGEVRLVATPVYNAPYCDGANYCSLIVVRKNSSVTSLSQLKGRVAATNKTISHSGYNAFRRLVADYVNQTRLQAGRPADQAGGARFFADVVLCGSHWGSLRAVASGKADVAAIDAVSFHLLSQGKPELTDAVRILTTTLPAPGLPLITAGGQSDDDLRLLRLAVMETLGDEKVRPALANMGIAGFQVLNRYAYGEILAFERQAEDMGYPVLA